MSEERARLSGWCSPVVGKPQCEGCIRHDRPCACPTCERLREALRGD